jgi:hypothetical protein
MLEGLALLKFIKDKLFGKYLKISGTSSASIFAIGILAGVLFT